MIELQHVSKTFETAGGRVDALKDVSLTIASGDIYGIIGMSGAGKSTLVRCINMLERPTSGKVIVNGQQLDAMTPAQLRAARREITMIFQRFNLLMQRTCLQNICFPMELAGAGRKEAQSKARELLELVGLPDKAQAYPDLYDYMTGIKYLHFIADVFGVDAQTRRERIRTYADTFELTGDLAQPIAAYSHGMKQKLAIIAAWLHDPRLIVMDEPFVGLDPKAAHTLKGMMRQVCDNGGAIFFSTHVLEVAEKLCDKVAIIKGGRLIRSGTMEEVKGDDSLEEVFLELEEDA